MVYGYRDCVLLRRRYEVCDCEMERRGGVFDLIDEYAWCVR